MQQQEELCFYKFSTATEPTAKQTITFRLNIDDFILPPNTTASLIESVFITASFTLWSKDEGFKMERQKDTNIWNLAKPLGETRVPGNSGFPEFNFLIFTEDKAFNLSGETPLSQKTLQTYSPTAKSFCGNFVILNEEETACFTELKAHEKELLKIQSLKDYDLKNPDERKRISNVRKVPHTTQLWRGYHPYKKSRPNFDTENTRLKLVNKLIKQNRIKSIITLCGNERPEKALKENISHYVQKIQRQNNQLFIDTSYETVYFLSHSKEFSNVLTEISLFMLSHLAPFYIHCRLGSDRTGTISAVFAALCGAAWAEITQDYEKTSKAGFGEFRSKRLLEYSFTKLLGKNPNEYDNLQAEIEDYFIRQGILSKVQIEKLQKKLKQNL